MQVIIPLAGHGTRLLPLTETVPKPLVHVAGRPILDYLLEAIAPLNVEELILITGHLGDKVEQYVREHHAGTVRIVEQRVMDGTGGAVWLARPFITGPVLILFADTLFDADLTLIERTDADGIMWVKEVENPEAFGVIVTDDDGNVREIIEKQPQPVSNLANIGLFYIRNWQGMFEGLERVMSEPPINGEFFLTYAFQDMIDRGGRIRTARVAGWYDCGTLDTVLETNRHLLTGGRGTHQAAPDGVTIHPPVRIDPSAGLRNCTIGPNVCIEDGSSVDSSRLQDTVVGSNCRLVNSTFERCLIGDGVTLESVDHRNKIIAKSGVAGAR